MESLENQLGAKTYQKQDDDDRDIKKLIELAKRVTAFSMERLVTDLSCLHLVATMLVFCCSYCSVVLMSWRNDGHFVYLNFSKINK